MNTGLQMTLQVEVTDHSLPILYPDRNMSNGTLFLFDGGRELPTSLVSGSKIPNIATETSKTLVGATLDADVNADLVVGAGFAGSIGKIELTPKGGIHTIISQTLHTATISQYAAAYLPTLIRDYIYTNRTHNFFISVWRRNTRVALTGASSAKLDLLLLTTGVYLTQEVVSTSSDDLRPSSGALLARRQASPNALGDYIKNIAVNGPTGDPSTNATLAKSAASNAILACGGGLTAFTAGGLLNVSPSFVTYRVLIEDLTVSGRTYAQADAIDIAQFTDAFAIGGRFYGDTLPTNPSVIP